MLILLKIRWKSTILFDFQDSWFKFEAPQCLEKEKEGHHLSVCPAHHRVQQHSRVQVRVCPTHEQVRWTEASSEDKRHGEGTKDLSHGELWEKQGHHMCPQMLERPHAVKWQDCLLLQREADCPTPGTVRRINQLSEWEVRAPPVRSPTRQTFGGGV